MRMYVNLLIDTDSYFISNIQVNAKNLCYILSLLYFVVIRYFIKECKSFHFKSLTKCYIIIRKENLYTNENVLYRQTERRLVSNTLHIIFVCNTFH